MRKVRACSAPGDISIVVVDPAIEGNAGRIARWSFDADQIAQYVRRNHDGGSLRFELHWPSSPEHSDLRLFVRFTTFDGRRLEANLPIEAQVADAESAKHRWTKSMASLAAAFRRRAGGDAGGRFGERI